MNLPQSKSLWMRFICIHLVCVVSQNTAISKKIGFSVRGVNKILRLNHIPNTTETNGKCQYNLLLFNLQCHCFLFVFYQSTDHICIQWNFLLLHWHCYFPIKWRRRKKTTEKQLMIWILLCARCASSAVMVRFEFSIEQSNAKLTKWKMNHKHKWRAFSCANVKKKKNSQSLSIRAGQKPYLYHIELNWWKIFSILFFIFFIFFDNMNKVMVIFNITNRVRCMKNNPLLLVYVSRTQSISIRSSTKRKYGCYMFRISSTKHSKRTPKIRI